MKGAAMDGWRRWGLIGLVLLILIFPVIYYRASYAHAKRLRVVTPGRVYRSGQMTAEGFREAIRRYGIRAVVNLQDEYPDPRLTQGYLNRSTIRETDLCRELGVKYIHLSLDLLPKCRIPQEQPRAIADIKKVLDDPSNYPLLIHCRAGLHRTGCMVAVYRMYKEGWEPRQAFAEMKGHGFGDAACTASNMYVEQYVLRFFDYPGESRLASPRRLKAGQEASSILPRPLPVADFPDDR
jgi:protein tyrosine phosphatase (PTP) superfamily phosphohydrolase (DUF442 family)